MHGLRFIAAILLLMATGITGCVSTTLQTDWKDPGFSGKFKKILVVCLAQEMVVRNTLEDDLAAKFSQRGIVAVQSYQHFASLKNIDKEMVRRKVRELDADGVFLVRPIGKDAIQVGTVAGNNYYDQWGSFAQQTYTNQQTSTVSIYRVESSLYEAGKGQVVWQAISDTFEDGPWMKTLQFFAETMTKKMIERGLI